MRSSQEEELRIGSETLILYKDISLAMKHRIEMNQKI